MGSSEVDVARCFRTKGLLWRLAYFDGYLVAFPGMFCTHHLGMMASIGVVRDTERRLLSLL